MMEKRDLLIKYCEKQFNATKTSKLLIGNLHKYRDIENAGLEDTGEGTFEFTVEINERLTISSNWASLIFGSAIGFGSGQRPLIPGRFKSHIEYCEAESVFGDTVVLKRAKAKVSHSQLNSYIFCCSMAEQGPSNPFPFYDDHWVVGTGYDPANDFSMRVGRALMSQVKLSLLEGDLQNLSLAQLQRLSINVQHRPVEYVERELLITPSMAEHFDQIMSTYLTSSFVKPKSFAKEQEYRFVFTPTVDNLICEVKKEDVILDLNALTAKI